MGAQGRARGRNSQAVASAFGFGRLAAGWHRPGAPEPLVTYLDTTTNSPSPRP